MRQFRLLLLLCLASVCAISAFAQIVPIVSNVSTGTAAEGKPLLVTVDLTQNVDVTQVLLVYRQFGESEFKELEMALKGRSATITLPGDIIRAPYVEYYVRVNMVGGKVETYPVQNPDANPLKISIKEPDPKDSEVKILSPEPGEPVAIEDLGIIISFFNASAAVNPKATKLYLDGIDVSAQAVLSEDLLIFSPQNFDRPLGRGQHAIKIELYDTTGKAYHSVQQSFDLSTAADIESQVASFRGRVDGQLEIRNEALSTTNRTYARGDLRADGNYSVLSFGGLMHLDNQDKPEVQPQNRFNMYAQTDWLQLEYGDAYPRFPSLLASGKRVRGFTARLATGIFNLDITTGETSRSVEGIVDSVVAVDTANTVLPMNSRLLRDTTYEFFQSGTFTRKFIAVRPSFGSSEEGTQFGLNFLKAKDDVGSILRGTLPEENLVAGADFRVSMDDQKFRWDTQAMLSLTNNDISNGSFTDADYDLLKAQDSSMAEDLKKLGKIAEKIITINEYLFPTNPIGKGLPSVALESQMVLNYFNNYLTGTFFRRGASYKSFGNEYVQADIQGFYISDRIRMFDNRVYLSLSYEKKNDNTAETKVGTTNFNNFNSSVTVNPRNFPAFTLGYGFNTRVADFNILHPDSVQVSKFADETTNRFFLGGGYDFAAMGNRQNLTVTFSLATKSDRTFYKADQTNLFVQTSLTTEYKIPLQTTIGLSVSTNENNLQTFKTTGADSVLSVAEFNYTAIILAARYRVLEDKLRLAADISPIFGIINRINYQVGALYVITQNHNLEFFLNFIQNSNQKDDMITSLIYRFNF